MSSAYPSRSSLWRLLAALFSLSLVAAACGADGNDAAPAPDTSEEAAEPEEEEMEEMADIVTIAVESGSFPTLVAAVQAAGLVETLQGDGPFTVFAPTEEAFAAALDALGITAEELLADTDTLTAILTYHVVPGKVMAADVLGLDGASVATVNGAEITIGVDGDTVTINNATVTAVDIEGSNGVIHVIDTVLLPPAAEDAAEEAAEPEEEEMEEMADIVTIAVESGSFPTLVAAVQAAGLVETLQGDGPFTVFAPTEEAFAAALDALGITAEELLADTDTLTAILTYHVVPGKVMAADVLGLDGASVATVNGAEITIGVDGDTVTINNATVTAVDIEGSNGVIHVIDTVLLPPAS